MVTEAPSRAAAAWFAPLTAARGELSVGYRLARLNRSTLTTKSWFMEPTTKTSDIPVSFLLEVLRDVFLRHQLDFDGDVLLHGLAVDHLHGILDP